jgi:hypothetical protein
LSARRIRRIPASAAALLAVALLAFAVIRSTVMQAQAATPWGMAPICSVENAGGHDDYPRKAPLASCRFCTAAAHVPLPPVAKPFPTPVCVLWRTAVAAPAPLLRQLGAPLPRARGPPDAV